MTRRVARPGADVAGVIIDEAFDQAALPDARELCPICASLTPCPAHEANLVASGRFADEAKDLKLACPKCAIPNYPIIEGHVEGTMARCNKSRGCSWRPHYHLRCPMPGCRHWWGLRVALSHT